MYFNQLSKITELLAEVQPKNDRNKALDEVLHELNTLLLSLPDGEMVHEVSCFEK